MSVAYAKLNPRCGFREAYFCDACDRLWYISQHQHCPRFNGKLLTFWPQLTSMPKMSLTEFWKWLAKKKYDKHSDLGARKGKKIFPQFGPLISSFADG